jgi:PHD/YefM family antitoxin component YafN of YafNO toxin-antitoxin module
MLSDEVRREWRGVLDVVEHRGEHVTVMRYKTPAVVIVPVGWYQSALSALADGPASAHGLTERP